MTKKAKISEALSMLGIKSDYSSDIRSAKSNSPAKSISNSSQNMQQHRDLFNSTKKRP